MTEHKFILIGVALAILAAMVMVKKECSCKGGAHV